MRRGSRFQRRPRLTMLLFWCCLLLAVEAGLRLAGPEILHFTWSVSRLTDFHPRRASDFRPNVSQTLRLTGSDGVAVYNFIVSTDSHGLRCPDRGPAPSSMAGSDGPTWIHALGDSFTMGWGVDYASSYPAALDRMTGPGARVLNLGKEGFGAVASTDKSMKLARDFPPSAAVYLFFENDPGEDAEAVALAKRPSWRKNISRAMSLARRYSCLANAYDAARAWAYFKVFLDGDWPEDAAAPPLAEARIHTLDLPVDTAFDPAHPTFTAMAGYAAFAEQQGIPFLVLIIGDSNPALQAYAFCRSQGIEARAIGFPTSLQLPKDGHLSARGNQRLAEYVHGLLFPSEVR